MKKTKSNTVCFYAIEDVVNAFSKELNAPVYAEKPKGFGERRAQADEAFVCGAVLKKTFHDSSGILETVYEDFIKYLSLFCEGENSYVFRIVQTELDEEAFRLLVSDSECVIFAGDTEGVRRALYFIEDEMIRRDGPFLPKGILERKPQIKRRITRNFFTPHEANQELQSVQDFYPDGYLARLAHEGINGLWIFLQFDSLLPSHIVSEYGRNSEKMLEKLRSIVKKCARYGIRVYGLGVEPHSTHNNEVLREKYSGMLGSPFWGGKQKAVCPSTKKGRAYIEECMFTLFTLVPDLAGFIGITLGEAVAGCGSVATKDSIACPHCRAAGLSKPGALAETERLLKRGMQRAKPDGEFISWTYAVRGWTAEMQAEHGKVRDETIPLMNNFEDRGTVLQLGKERTTVDYWLSYAGPGEVFRHGAETANGAPLYAKLQICASHELATVPYVPVPGILYDKYKEMHRLGVTGAVYCWFFGNYPSLMNKAASELGFLPFPNTKEAFLRRLSALYTNTEDAEILLEAWRCFEKGYSLCPYNVAFAWFGPLNDAPMRPLHLLPIDMAVPSNWLLSDSCEGDRFGEFTGMTHTPEEAELLLSDMETYWKKGDSLLSSISVPEEMRNVSAAISILISSAKNILSFYLLRNRLGYGEGIAEEVLHQMEKIAKEEILHSEALARLCEKDPRLGYHSEAVGYKFSSEKLLWRVERLRKMLKDEFSEVEERMQDGKCPLSFFTGEGSPKYSLSESPWETFCFSDGTEDADTRIRVQKMQEAFLLEIDARHDDPICIDAEFRMFIPYVPVHIDKDGTVNLIDDIGYYLDEEKKAEETAKWRVSRENGIYRVFFDKNRFSLSDGKPFRIAVRRLGSYVSSWKQGTHTYTRLIYGQIKPDEKVFIL